MSTEPTKPEGTQVTFLGLPPEIARELSNAEGLRGGYFVSFDLAHTDRKIASDEAGNANALGKMLNATRQKLWRDLRYVGCPKVTQSFYYIPAGLGSTVPNGIKIHDDMTKLEIVQQIFENIAKSFAEFGHGVRAEDADYLIAPLVTTTEKWEAIHASAMDNVLVFLQRKIDKLGELSTRPLEKGDSQAFSTTRNEVFEIMRMVESTPELRDSEEKLSYDTAITSAQELINAVAVKVKQAKLVRGTISA